ncbi:MAG: TonB-dependent receptor [Acidobacteria bacterium]|nr:TonB-dependent receptor [Acidobacteriota bacterium]
MKSRTLISSLALLVFLAGQVAAAQVTTGTILGTVRDASGAVIPGATVSVRNVDTGITRTVTTDAAGRYRAPQLGLGNYELAAESAGFQTSVRSGITLTVGREATVDFSMQVGAVAERITVTGEAPLVETTNATVSSLVDERQMRDIPLAGRNFTDLTMIQPGAINISTVGSSIRTGGNARRISIDGARSTQSLYMLDGIETMHINSNSPPSSVLGRQKGTEAVREFNLLSRNYGAQYGRAAGGVVNSVTRSGTNDWHGGLYHFFRNDALDANTYFVPTDAPKLPLKQNQFGGTLGGPIQRDRTFFFVNFDAERQRRGTSDFTAFLDDDAREGLITRHQDAAGNPIPTGRWRVDPSVIITDFRPIHPFTQAVIRQLAERCEPGAQRLGDGRCRYAASRTEKAKENYGMFRIDQQISEVDSIFGRLTVDYSDNFLVDVGNNPDFANKGDGSYYLAALQYTRIISPTVLNVASLGFTRTRLLDFSVLPGNLDPILNCTPGIILCQSYTPGGAGVAGIHSGGDDVQMIGNTFTYQDQISLTKGNHSIVTGAEIKRYQTNEFQNIWIRARPRWTGGLGPWYRAQMQNILGALPQSENPFVPPTVYLGYRQTYGAIYFQDNIQVVPNLTVNLGLRWEMLTDPTDVHGRAASIVDVLRDSGPTFGKVFDINPSWKGFSPRAGFAWTPFDGGTTVVRGGWGVFTEWPLKYLYLLSNYFAPHADRVTVANPVLPFPFAGIRPGDPAFADVRTPIVNEYDWRPAYTYQTNLGLEQQLGQSYVVRATYIGSRTYQLAGVANPIAPYPSVDRTGRLYVPANGRSLNPNFASMRGILSGGNAWYNALQLVGERRFAAGLGFRLSFNWSKNIDDASVGTQGGDSAGSATIVAYHDRRAEKSLSSLDNRRSLIFSFNYELPVGAGKPFGSNLASWADYLVGGWQLNGVFSVRDGLPANVNMGNLDCSGNKPDSSRTERPDLRPGASNNPILGSRRDFREEERYFDRTAFVAPPSCYVASSTDLPARRGYYGNVGRNTLINPGLLGNDFSLFKNFRVGEGKTLQFRAEVFNLLNRANFGLSAANAGALSSGRTFLGGNNPVIDPNTGYPVPGGARPDGGYNVNAGIIDELAEGTTMRQIQLALRFTF